MISKVTEEYREGDMAVCSTVISLFHIPIFRGKNTTTNSSIVNQLTPIKKVTKVKGFKHENKD